MNRKLQCLTCERRACMVRPRKGSMCPYRLRMPAALIATRIAFAVVLIGIMAAIFYISL